MPANTDLDRGLAFTENDVLAWGDYIPVVSTISGFARYLLGKVEVIVAVSVAIFKFIASLFKSAGERKVLEKEAIETLHYAAHGLANMFRGLVAMVPVLGNISCLVYDLTGNRLRYPGEKQAQPL